MHGGNKKDIYTQTNLQLKVLFKYVTFLLPSGIKGLMKSGGILGFAVTASHCF